MGFDLGDFRKITSDVNSVVKSLQSLGATVDIGKKNSSALGTRSIIPGISGVKDILSGSTTTGTESTSGDTTTGSSISNTSDSGRAVTTRTQAEKGAFKWVEQFVTPDMFATAESCLIGYSVPIKGAAAAGDDFKLLGFCENLTINTGVSVVALKELRSERNLIIPTKSTPGSISISRLLGGMPSFVSTVSGGTGWTMDSRSSSMKKLFGLVLIFMSPSRKDTFTTLYAERCAVQSVSIPVQAGQFQLYESVQIVFDRIVDGSSSVSNNSVQYGSTTSAVPTVTPMTEDLLVKNPLNQYNYSTTPDYSSDTSNLLSRQFRVSSDLKANTLANKSSLGVKGDIKSVSV